MKKKIGALVGVFALAGILSASALTASAKSNDDGTRPGWGFGDDNHVHIGPPGQSVHPQAVGAN